MRVLSWLCGLGLGVLLLQIMLHFDAQILSNDKIHLPPLVVTAAAGEGAGVPSPSGLDLLGSNSSKLSDALAGLPDMARRPAGPINEQTGSVRADGTEMGAGGMTQEGLLDSVYEKQQQGPCVDCVLAFCSYQPVPST